MMDRAERIDQDKLEAVALEAEQRTWEWRNLRQVGFGVTFWPFQWGLGGRPME